jgi:hypothetical protein
MLDIINQIDAYLTRLRLARDILAKSLPDSPAKRKRKTRTVVSAKAQRSASSRSKVLRGSRTSAQKPAVPVEHIPISPTAPVENVASLSDLVSIIVPEGPALPNANTERLPSVPDINIQRLPYRRPRGSLKPAYTRSLRVSEPTHSTGALVGSVNSKIVVVSPEQARKERERTSQIEIQPRGAFKSGLTGRLAFESLFKDTNNR